MKFTQSSVENQKKDLNSISRRFTTKMKSVIIKLALFAIIFAAVVGVSAGLGVFSGILQSTPDISTINVSPTKFATKILDNKGNEIETLISEGSNRVYVPLDQIPLNLQHAFIAIEDERFYTHNGIDLKGIGRAAYVALSTRDLSQGASTITQQLIKNTVFEAYNETTIEKIQRKIQEQYLAIKLDSDMGKDAILENYLNIINLGNGNLGVQAAANNYFDKDVSELTLSECAVIAAITKNPSRLNPVRNPEDNKERQQDVLEHMYDQGYITEAEYKEALADPVYSRIQDIHVVNNSSSVYSYYTDALIEVLIKDLTTQLGYTENQATTLIYSGGLQVYSAQDMEMQAIAEEILNDPDNWPTETPFVISLDLTVQDKDGNNKYLTHQSMLNYFQKEAGYPTFDLLFTDEEKAQDYINIYKDYWIEQGYEVTYENVYYVIQPQISFTLMDQYTGEVKVIVGGRGEKYTSRSMNRATNTTRSPGSTIKPLVAYGPALDVGGKTLATVYDDCAYYYKNGGKLVNDWDNKYYGIMGMREALYRSRNIPAVKCLNDITPDVGVSYLERFGLSTLVLPENAINGMHDVIESIALGGMTKGVYNIDMCAAYAAYANSGTYTSPVYYTKVLDHDGNLLLDNSNPETHRVVKDTTAWLMTNCMQDVVIRGTGTQCKVPNQPVSGKTGTSNSGGDIWFCGFTPYYTAAIWMGYDDDASRGLKDQHLHNVLWSKVMTKIHEDLPTGSFRSQPSNIVSVAVCSQSGLLPVAGLCDADPRGSQVVSEYFEEGTQPTQTCTAHQVQPICVETNHLSIGSCPAEYRVVVVRPPNDTVVPEDQKDATYTTLDAAYTIDYELSKAVCPVHSADWLFQMGYLSGLDNGMTVNDLGQTDISYSDDEED